MPHKDLLTLLVSASALITSISVGFFNYRVQRARERDDARKALEEAMSGLHAARAEIQKLRIDTADRFDQPEVSGSRVAIVWKRNLHLAKALQVVRTRSPLITSADSMLLAATLIDSGRIAAAIPFYRMSMEKAGDDLEKADAQRVLGRSLILGGTFEEGRNHMIEAAKQYAVLADDAAYDRQAMITEEADTYRRLIEASIQRRCHGWLRDDIAALEARMPRVGNPVREMSRRIIADAKGAAGIAPAGGDREP